MENSGTVTPASTCPDNLLSPIHNAYYNIYEQLRLVEGDAE